MERGEDEEVTFEFMEAIRVYKSGRIERLLGNDIVPASIESPSGVSSKDITISPDVSARLFLPNIIEPAKKVAVLVYFHGGGFFFETPFSPLYHNYVSSLASAANVVAVSIHYRRAPEHPLPAAYDDCWAAFQWVVSHADGGGSEPWLANHGDFKRIVIAGDSAGGNITHQTALRAGEEGALKTGTKLEGAMIVNPYFWGSEGPPNVEPEMSAKMDKFWKFVCPGTTGIDDPRSNPLATGSPALTGLGCGRVLVCLAEKDFLREWGLFYYQGLASSGYEGTVEILEMKGEEHVFHLFKPECENAKELMKRMVDFINQGN
ncbi:tuliposide A-converting enzyme 1, chloroplastic-like [Aristolochia californica]|uniref:tuliposide A-converting enzyme 1, chloroplastic-like n=1 Tax=Aristolochia californica TaxID=171875 RepID=UPI0035DD3E6D